jgi:hypothetical protein
MYKHLSRNAAIVNSQGRKPLVLLAVTIASPNGAAVRPPYYYRPAGAYGYCAHWYQGLTPLVYSQTCPVIVQ